MYRHGMMWTCLFFYSSLVSVGEMTRQARLGWMRAIRLNMNTRSPSLPNKKQVKKPVHSCLCPSFPSYPAVG
ncbi:hypothetical protein BKA57DRAFT_459629 [Linnemannia elongata]|nr:hypothetical protein BKA57DRAFT_459629 [Linnemannia elongata]